MFMLIEKLNKDLNKKQKTYIVHISIPSDITPDIKNHVRCPWIVFSSADMESSDLTVEIHFLFISFAMCCTIWAHGRWDRWTGPTVAPFISLSSMMGSVLYKATFLQRQYQLPWTNRLTPSTYWSWGRTLSLEELLFSIFVALLFQQLFYGQCCLGVRTLLLLNRAAYSAIDPHICQMNSKLVLIK